MTPWKDIEEERYEIRLSGSGGQGIILASVVLAAGVVAMVNYLADRYYMRWDLSWRGFYGLSDKTISLLEDLSTDIEVVAFIQRNYEMRDDVANLLKEYQWNRKQTFHPPG